MPTNKGQTIPLTVITGFLGAGKTTYLNELIRKGLPPGALILVNDFGDINIDAELIEYQDDRILRLSNGCICCTLGGTLAEQLAEALRLSEAPGAIYIEASGVADPARIADIARVSRRLQLADVVCLVDGSQVLRQLDDELTADVWIAQVRAATHLRVNRLANADDEAKQAVLTRLFELNPTAALALDSRMAEHTCQAPPPTRAHHPLSGHGGRPKAGKSAWSSFSLTFEGGIDDKLLESMLRAYSDVLLRAKGILTCYGHPQAQVMQLSGGKLSWVPAARTPGKGQLVCIGVAGERLDALSAELQRLKNSQAIC